MDKLKKTKFLAIDFETTGHVKGYKAEPWQIGVISIENMVVQPDSMFESLIRVGERPFSIYAPGRYEELRDEIRCAPSMDELWPRVNSILGNADIILAHNTPTERKILGEYYPFLKTPMWVDTLTLARSIYPDAVDFSLSVLLKGLKLYDDVRCICPGREEHDALFDAVGCAVLFVHFMHLPGWTEISLEKLLKLG